jgi:hypothetical protein
MEGSVNAYTLQHSQFEYAQQSRVSAPSRASKTRSVCRCQDGASAFNIKKERIFVRTIELAVSQNMNDFALFVTACVMHQQGIKK